MKRSLVLLAVVLAAAVFFPTHASAQVLCDATISGDTCIDNFAADPVASSGAGFKQSSICNNNFGCLLCEFTPDVTMSICVRVMGANGFCNCKSGSAPKDGFPVCSGLSGSCRYR